MSKTYLVGGAVRDQLLGYPFVERDWVVVGSTPEEMLTKGFKPVGKDFPVFLHPDTSEEYALARTERKTAPGYSGFSFHTAPDITLEEDLQRRDLTINAIAEDTDGTLVDPYNGQGDITQKILRHVSPAFNEDPVRILRVARFAARYHHLGFTVADETQALMRSMVDNGEASHLVPERVWKEFEKALTERSPGVFIETLHACGALAVLLPELAQLFAKTDDLYGSQGQRRLAALSAASTQNQSATIRFACLMHDTSSAPDVAAEQVQQACARLATPKAYRDLAIALCLQQNSVDNFMTLSGAELLQLLQSLDALRRPEKMQDVLNCCEAEQQALHIAQGSQGTRPFPQRDHLETALALCLEVTAKDLVAEGLSGKAIGDTMQHRRIEQLTQLQAGSGA